MANILTHPTNGAIYFDDGTAGSSTVPALTGDAVSLNYDGGAGLNITSYNTTSTDRFSIDGDSGRLFSVNDSLTGTIFSVNDAAGLPIIEVESTSTTDTITMGTYASNALVVAGDRVGIGTASPSSSYKLDVVGSIQASSNIHAIGNISATGNFESYGSFSVTTIDAATSDLDKFLVSDGGTIKYRTGAQVASDIGLGNVTNESKATMFSSPSFTGTPIAPTASANTNTTQIATTAYVQTEIGELIGGAPGALDTLNELAAAIGDDASYASSITTALAAKAPLASPNFTGDVDVAGSITTEGPDGGMVMREWTGGSSYGMIGTANMSGNEYVLLTSGGDTFISAGGGGSVHIRGGNNDTVPSIDVTTSNIEFNHVPSAPSEATALVWDGTNVGYRELGSAAFSATSAFAAASHTQAFSTITSTPTTVAGYGITDAVATSALSSYLPLAGGTIDGSLIIDTDTSAQPFYITRSGATDQSLKIYVDDQNAIFESIQDETADDYGGFIFNMDAGTTHPYFDVRKNNSTIMRVDGGGNVGIGTTSPSEKLHVNGIIRTHNSDVAKYINIFGGNSGNFIDTYGNSLHIRYGGDSNKSILLDSAGNVGIGTTSPSSKLHVAGQIMISPSSGTPSLKFQDSGTTNAYIDLTDGQQRFDFRDDSDTVMSVRLDTLRVGIGTTSPSYKLDVAGASNSTSLHVNGIDQHSSIRYTLPSQSVSFARTAASNGSDQWFKIYSGGGSTTLIRLSINSGGDNTQSNDEFLISVAGYGFKHHIQRLPAGRYNGSKLLAIATTNPSAAGTVEIWIKLDGMVSGTASTHIFANAGLQSSANILSSATGTAPTITSNGTQLDISATNRNDTTIMASRGATFGGNVGIGTTSPSNTLDIAGGLEVNAEAYIRSTNNVGLRIQTTDQGTTGTDGLRVGLNATHAFVWQYENLPLAFATNGSQKATILANGNFGIGNAAPSYKLDVNGDFRVVNAATFSAGTYFDQYLYHAGDTDTFIRFQPNDVNLTAAGQNLLRVDGNSTQKTVVVNEVGIDADFRVEASGEANALFVRGSDGNVGIGTTSPQNKLDVSGVIRSNASNVGSMYLGNTNQSSIPAGAVIGQRSPSNVNTGNLLLKVPTWGTGTDYGLTTQMSIEVSAYDTKEATISMIPFGGKVGIGTTSPTSPLTIKSNSTSSSSSGLTIQSNGNTNNIFELAEKSTDGARLQMYDAGVAKIAFYTDGTNNYINAGNVGIGTTSPSAKLELKGSTTDSTANTFVARDSASASLFSIRNDGRVDATGDLVVGGNLTVNGTTTTINSTTISVDDKNIELGTVATPTDTTADGGGITLKGATDKTINWVNSTGAWTFSEDVVVSGDITTGGTNATVKADRFSGIGTGVVVGTNSNGTVFLRPAGVGSTTNQSTFTGTLATIGTNATFAGNIVAGGAVYPATNAAASLGLSNKQWAGLDLSSSSAITWGNGDAEIIEGETNNYSLTFKTYDGSANSAALRLDGDNTATFTGNIIALTGGGSGNITVGRNANEKTVIDVGDQVNSITAYQDSDGNATHNFVLNRVFAGTGTNDFIIQKDGTAQFTLDTSANATFAGSVTATDGTFTGDLTVSGEVEFSALNSASASPFVVSDGGTLGTRTAAEVLDDIGGRITKKISGDGTATTFAVTHSFGTPHVMTQLLHYGNNGTGATYEVVNATVKRNSDNAIDVIFGVAPTTSEDYLVLITKMPAIS